ncbi:uncharacterized protein [Ptychodera flava]|uniref:uncharacterized protein isoform X2 n=1 Tax=Ptychodera flava TaxID=63121 RepID=UPI003969DE13
MDGLSGYICECILDCASKRCGCQKRNKTCNSSCRCKSSQCINRHDTITRASDEDDHANKYICECILDCASKRCGCQKRNKTCNSSCRCKSSQCINRHDTITRASDEDDHANKSTMKVTKKEIANDGVDPSPLARTEDEIGNDNITEPLQKKETNTSKQNGRGGGINSTFNWNTKEHSWTDQVFAEVTSRLDANSGGHKKKKYSVTVNKLKRRMSAPERMSRNTVTKYLRLDSGKGLGRESVNRLFNSLNHNDSGRGAKSTAFTLLTEGEVKDLAHSILAVGSTTVTCAQLIEEKNEEGGILHKANFIAARKVITSILCGLQLQDFDLLTHGGSCIIDAVFKILLHVIDKQICFIFIISHKFYFHSFIHSFIAFLKSLN